MTRDTFKAKGTPPPAAARGDVRGLVAKWRAEANAIGDKVAFGEGLAAGCRVSADELEAALAAEGEICETDLREAAVTQAGEVERRMIDLDRAMEVVTRFCGRTSSMTRYISEDLAALSQQPEARGVVEMPGMVRKLERIGRLGEGEPVWIEPSEAIAILAALTGERNG